VLRGGVWKGGEYTQTHSTIAIWRCQGVMSKYKPTFSNQEMLEYIYRHPGCSTNELVKRFKVTRQDIHHRAKRLVKRGQLLIDVGHGRRPSRFTVTKRQTWRVAKHAT
jgi:DNA-binding MarR family transcriptional regulator